MEGENFKRDAAHFYGEASEVRSQGSAFEANKAAFFAGERPNAGFKVKATGGITGKDVAVN